MIDPNIFLGEPINFQGICKIYPPTVRDVITNPEIQKYIAFLCWNQDDIEEILEKKQITLEKKRKLTPFEFILVNCYNDVHFSNSVEAALKFFTREKEVHIFPNQLCIYFGSIVDISKAEKPEDIRCLTDKNFFDFQNAIRSTLGFELEEPEDENLNPIVKRIRQAAKKRRKLMRKNSSNNGGNYTNTLAVLCCMNMGLNPLNLGDIPYAAIGVLINTYQRKEKYEADIQSICAGADPKKVKPKYWIRPDDDGIHVSLSGISGSKKQ